MIKEHATKTTEQLRLGAADYAWHKGQLHDDRGRRVPLRAKSLKMFAALLADRGKVLTKDQLSELVWPDTIATDESIARCIADIRKVLHDHAHTIVETFPKQGYRLNVVPAAETSRKPGKTRLRSSIVALVAVCLLGGIGLVRAAMEYGPTVADEIATLASPVSPQTVAILRFATDAEQDRFLAAGLTEDLEIHLAELSGIRVVSHARTGSGMNAPQALIRSAGSLDADYFVNGSLRQDGGNVALSLQLIDGSDGVTVWADRYEGSRMGLMSFRATLPDALVAAMAVELNARDLRRLSVDDTNDPLAFEQLLQARQALSLFSYEGSLEAERHLRRAVAHDPEYGRAYAELASAFVIRMENNWLVLSTADTDKAFYFAEKALDLDPDLWFAHYILGRLHSVARNGDTQAALRHLEKAMSLQPANDDARVYYAVVLTMSGHLGEGAAILEGVIATHPQPPFWYYLGLGNVLFHQHRYAEAADAASKCLQQMPTSPYCLRARIAVLARLGHLDDAAWTVEEYAILGQETSLDALMKTAIERDPAMRAHLRTSYAMAGIE